MLTICFSFRIGITKWGSFCYYKQIRLQDRGISCKNIFSTLHSAIASSKYVAGVFEDRLYCYDLVACFVSAYNIVLHFTFLKILTSSISQCYENQGFLSFSELSKKISRKMKQLLCRFGKVSTDMIRFFFFLQDPIMLPSWRTVWLLLEK